MNTIKDALIHYKSVPIDDLLYINGHELMYFGPADS